MLVKGDKIKLVKEICGFNQIGDIFEIVNITGDGAISFNCDYGIGMMSYDEFEKHFVKVEQHQWTNWISVKFTEDGIALGWCPESPYVYRTNGKKIELANGTLRTSASCLPTDTFDLVKGLILCNAKMKVKEILQQM